MNIVADNYTKVKPLDLATWYHETFIPTGLTGYAVMNPPWADAKYSRRKGETVSPKLVMSTWDGVTRRLPNAGQWETFPLSLAITPQWRNQSQTFAIDIDSGGADALAKLLATAKLYGLWGFAQLGESDNHSGGHAWFCCAQYHPAPMLREIAERLAIAVGIVGEYYPVDRDLRLPLMTHLRAPGGYRRFPILMPEGDLIDASDPWKAAEMLRLRLQRNGAATLVDALGKLPPLPVGGGDRPIHRSKVNPLRNESVIRWFNDNHTLRQVLEDAGATVDARVICCPHHDDQSPSLAIFRTEQGKDVCRCFSAQSNCPLADGAYFDAFDLYKLANNLSTVEAVKRLVSENKIGETTQTVIEHHEQPPQNTLAQHKANLSAARERLQNEIADAAGKTGQVTVIRATPGLGKTHISAEIANAAYRQGQHVAICAPTLDIATGEWAPRLDNPYVWQSKIAICICHDKEYLEACINHGYAYPECTNPDCPYRNQAIEAFGKQVIYQHAHLYLKDGHILTDNKLVIVDESPLNALLPERFVSPARLEGFCQRYPEDPAVPLLAALASAMRSLPKEISDTRGPELQAAIENQLEMPLQKALRMAGKSPHCIEMPQPPQEYLKMTQQFLFALVKVISNHFDKLSFGRNGRGFWGLVWHERQLMAMELKNSLYPPAVVVLDGSADETIYNELLTPWPLNMVQIDCDLSPTVELIQINCTPSTRHVVRDNQKLVRLARQIAHVCNMLGITLDGGVTYAGADKELQELLGGEWLHYGGQRGQNALQDASASAVVCSPTVPPAALERKALALWGQMDTTWTPTGKTGEYRANDNRLEAMAKIHGLEELRQAVYRVRPLSAEKPVKLLVFTPWDLSLIGLTPAITVDEIEHGKAAAVTGAINQYRARAGSTACAERGGVAHCNKIAIFNMEYNKESLPRVENGQNIAEFSSYSTKSVMHESPPLPAKEAVPARVAALETLAQWLGATPSGANWKAPVTISLPPGSRVVERLHMGSIHSANYGLTELILVGVL